MTTPFKKQYSFTERKAESTRILSKYSDRIPIIVEVDPRSKNLPMLDKKKFLCPHDLTVGQFVFIIRKRINLQPTKAIFLFVDNTLPQASSMLSYIYSEHQDEDRFLYVVIAEENTFG